MATQSLADILLNNAFLSLTVDNKILCSITKHEMPPKVDIVLGHINGKKLKKTVEWYNYDYSEFEPYIVPDRQNAMKLHCKLTGKTLNKIPEEIKKHTSGKKYLRLKVENEELQKKQAPKEKDTNPDIWVPPEELLEDEEEETAADTGGKKGSKKSIKGGAASSKEVEDDTFSDLLGSDHEDELDVEDGDDDEFDELGGDDEMDVTEQEDLPVISKGLKSSKKAEKKTEKKTGNKSEVAAKSKKAEKVEKVLTVITKKGLKRKEDAVETPAVVSKKVKSDTSVGKNEKAAPSKDVKVATKKDDKSPTAKVVKSKGK